MKKFLCIFFSVVLTVSAVVMTGCDGEKKDNAETKGTETTSQTEETKADKKGGLSEIESYLEKFTEGDSDFYGAWQPESFNYMSVVFRNDNLAEMVTGTEGYFSKYTLNEKKKTIKVQLMPNVIDGEYSYEFSDDKKKLTLTLDDNELVFIKQKDFSLIPEAPEKPVIDSEILGWWEDENGLFYCFQQDGIMYENSISMETCYTYTIKDNKIKATYSVGTEMNDEFTYSVKDGVLTLNDVKCKRKTV
ncbi:MAG: hypothetical protein K6F88_06640 [Ruminococcus sp.]|nr:hypothetical protein [Ruminococcus sp.]